MPEVYDKIKGHAVTNETLSEHSLGLAAQAWCEPETSHKIMDEALCMAFARILDRVKAQSDAEPVRVVHDDAFGWGVLLNGKPVKCLFNSKEETVAWLCAALAQSDAPRPDASAEQNILRYMRDDIDGDTRTPEQKQPGPKYVPIGGAGNGA
jgi:hypothetical protein